MRGVLFLLAGVVAFSQTPPAKPETEPEPVVTKHELQAGAKRLNYSVTTGRLPLANEQTGVVEGHVFFIAYSLETPTPKNQRPLMFSFNGGPGAASVWMHLGMIGPKRVRMLDDGSYPPPPFQLVDNEHTFLDFSDLVFIDTIGTGYSRAVSQDVGKKFWGVQGDIASVGEFIRLYLTRYQRWTSPLFLIGESYGTFRAAGVAGYLIDKGVAFNGVILVSSILNFQTARFDKANDLPYSLFLPTYTATAWYHKKLPKDLQTDLRKALRESEGYAMGEYAQVLAKGDRLTPQERSDAVGKLSRLTGLEKRFLEENDLRIEIRRFQKELLRTEGKTVGRLDSRLEASEGLNGAEVPGFDPALAAIRPPYQALIVDYLRGDLKYETDLPYYVLGGGIGPWEYGPGGTNRYADTSDALREAFAKNPYMRVLVTSGYYDLATPYFATEYTMSHLGIPEKFKPSIEKTYFEAGHMFYIHMPSLQKVSGEVANFVRRATNGRPALSQ
jgi:carboxypeptidase C (cathepsin A)